LFVVIVMERDLTALVAAAAGILLLEIGVWYAANPIFTNERRYVVLRSELDRFIDLVRELNKAAVTSGPGAEVDRLKTTMHESVDAMVRLADIESNRRSNNTSVDQPGNEPVEESGGEESRRPQEQEEDSPTPLSV
ncbi:MAG: hypothetical protein ACYTKC_19115, partial [Planctomycetota bacterium]